MTGVREAERVAGCFLAAGTRPWHWEDREEGAAAELAPGWCVAI